MELYELLSGCFWTGLMSSPDCILVLLVFGGFFPSAIAVLLEVAPQVFTVYLTFRGSTNLYDLIL